MWFCSFLGDGGCISLATESIGENMSDYMKTSPQTTLGAYIKTDRVWKKKHSSLICSNVTALFEQRAPQSPTKEKRQTFSILAVRSEPPPLQTAANFRPWPAKCVWCGSRLRTYGSASPATAAPGVCSITSQVFPLVPNPAENACNAAEGPCQVSMGLYADIDEAQLRAYRRTTIARHPQGRPPRRTAGGARWEALAGKVVYPYLFNNSRGENTGCL